MTEHLPIFPLRHCLLPGISLQLQIFEQRYLSLVRESLKNSEPFGVVAIEQGEEVMINPNRSPVTGTAPVIYPWGTLVDIRDWSQLDNGLLGIVVRGDRRIRVDSTSIGEDGLMQGLVQIYPPDPLMPVSTNVRDLQMLLQDLAQHRGVSDPEMTTGNDIASLCWQLSALLPLSVGQKQVLLSLDQPGDRLVQLRHWLQEMARG